MKGIVAGLGGRAGSWIETCRKMDVELCGYVEPNPERQQSMAERFSLPSEAIFPSMADALSSGDAGFVVDVTPPAAHEEIASMAFEAGLHVVGEKPLSDDLAAAKRMIAGAKASGLVHMITQNYRFGAMPRTTNRLLREGAIGEPEQVLVSFFMNWADSPGSHYVTQPYMLVKDMGVHHFDLLRYVLGRDAVEVIAKTWNPTWGWHEGDASHTAIFEMSGGLIATHHALGCSKGHRTTYNADWHIAGSEGSITWEGDAMYLTRGHRTENPGREVIEPDASAEGPLEAILSEFFAAIEEGREPECSSEDNLKSLVMTFAVVRSAEENRAVGMAEFLD